MTWGNHRTLCYPEQQRPCGEPGLRAIYFRGILDRQIDLSDCLVSRPSSWTLVIWEPLLTKAPGPPKALPYCCYLQTVIFYHRPYIVWPFKKRWRDGSGRLRAERGGFLEWDSCETRLTWDDVVEFQGERFQINGGTVVWANSRWWMCRGARRQVERAAA